MEVGEGGCCDGGGGEGFLDDVLGVNCGVVVHRGAFFEGRQEDGEAVEVGEEEEAEGGCVWGGVEEGEENEEG